VNTPIRRFFASLLIAASLQAGAAEAEDADFAAVFDRNKGGINAIYARALRENARLSGKMVLSIDIARTGDVTDCRVRSSTVGAPDFERKVCDRVLVMKFSPRASAFTVTKLVDFFPAK
jgi:TonB family protein